MAKFTNIEIFKEICRDLKILFEEDGKCVQDAVHVYNRIAEKMDKCLNPCHQSYEFTYGPISNDFQLFLRIKKDYEKISEACCDITIIFDKKKIHAELKIVKYVQNYKSKIDVPFYCTIGVSKLACAFCNIAIEHINKREGNTSKFVLKGTNGKCYKISYSSLKMLTEPEAMKVTTEIIDNCYEYIKYRRMKDTTSLNSSLNVKENCQIHHKVLVTKRQLRKEMKKRLKAYDCFKSTAS